MIYYWLGYLKQIKLIINVCIVNSMHSMCVKCREYSYFNSAVDRKYLQKDTGTLIS